MELKDEYFLLQKIEDKPVKIIKSDYLINNNIKDLKLF